MKPIRSLAAGIMTVATLSTTLPANAALTQVEADRLGKDLTPNGAEKAGNKDGTIPAWEGGMTKPPAGWKPEMGYVDPFANEKPLFVITAQNAEQYTDKLTTGQLAMLKRYSNFTMPVYPSHRTFAYPQFVYDATKAIATKASSENDSLRNYELPGTPFPIPKTGAEEILNHELRWFGAYDRCTDWTPVTANGEFYRVGICENFVQDQNFDKRQPNHLFSFYGAFDAPSNFLGITYLLHEPIDYSTGRRQAWLYNDALRRGRRAPNVAFDSPSYADEGMDMADAYWCFNGSLERYNWKLVGKQEKYIPYNAYKSADPELKYKDMVEKGTLKSDIFRYELHRVWEVEATLKPGLSHVYAKRQFYLDEDSHMIAWADSYDGRGNLWRVYSCPLMQAYDNVNMLHSMYIAHDIINGNYIMKSAMNERKQPAYIWGHKAKWADFQPDVFQRRGIH